jgi:hypothetical protein
MDSLTIDFIHQFYFMNMALTMVSSYGSFDAITDRLNMNINYTNMYPERLLAQGQIHSSLSQSL